MLWTLRILNGVAVLAALYAYFVDKSLLVPVLGFIGLLFLVSAIRKVNILGFDTLRGKFWAIFSLVGVFIFLSAFWHYGTFMNLLMHLLARFFLATTILMMSIGLAKRGFFLRGARITWVVLAFLLILVVMVLIIPRSPMGIVWAVLFAIMDIIVFTFTINNLLVYLGSELGRRWTEGVLAMLTYIVSDIFFILGIMDVAYLFLIIALSLMVLNALIEE